MLAVASTNDTLPRQNDFQLLRGNLWLFFHRQAVFCLRTHAQMSGRPPFFVCFLLVSATMFIFLPLLSFKVRSFHCFCLSIITINNNIIIIMSGVTSSSIPMMRSPANQMEAGPNGSNLAATATRNHVVDDIQRSGAGRGFLDLDGVRRLYGSGLAMRLATERQLASSQKRLPGMPESNLQMDILTGDDTMLDFRDVLGRPEDAPVAYVKDAHSAMQRKLGL